MPNLIKNRSIFHLMLVTLVTLIDTLIALFADFQEELDMESNPSKGWCPATYVSNFGWPGSSLRWSWRLKGCFTLASPVKGFLWEGPPPPAHWPDEYAILMSPYKGKTVSIAATAGVIWLCACVRYRPYRGVGLDGLLWKMIFLKQIKYF